MRAVALTDSLALAGDWPEPTARPGQVLVRVRVAGICNTDLELINGYMGFNGVLGHEFVGDVVDGDAMWRGLRVVGEINVACGACDMCDRGNPTQCRNRVTVGIDRHDGAMADRVALSTANLHLVPDSVTDDQAVFTEPLAAALQILECGAVSPRDDVIVVGVGKLGMLAAQVLALTGASVRAVVRRQSQADLLTRWGIVPVAYDDLPRKRADVVVDCTGTADGFASALDLVRPRGTIHLKSTYAGLPQADLTRIVVDEIRLIGSRCGPFEPALRLLERRRVEVEPLIEARYPLDDALAAFEHAARPGTLKVLLDI